MALSWWPLLVLAPAVALYFYFKLTERDLMQNWSALIKDGLASGVAFLACGIAFFVGFSEGWLHWLGLILAVWSLTYFGSAYISYRNLQTEKRGGKVPSPLQVQQPRSPARPNRAQRRSSRQR